ncbi:MAG: DUF72 domain-containing protein [candidate division Zixibacteria bacterium]|nr:DUF72 domain-containing protein [candidate division Zixibacteria bacterium]MDH3937791.1 DUF72 domain-containing protein [candidate division Zixibacteria bacterium]MDH4034866.1 DUF72 domain-containing protein [candidate division Zixibacteria bacterium]
MSIKNAKVGTSGFSYKDWLGNFYPQFCPPADFLRFYSSVFTTVEIDATFYRIPKPETVERWAGQVRDGFIFAAKFPRTVTHEGKPAERLKTAIAFTEVMRGLGDRLGPLLLQYPYSFKPTEFENLRQLLAGLPADLRIALELRNKAWLKEAELFDLLQEYNIAFTLIDHPWMPRQEIATADFHYIRFLGDRKQITDDFSHVRINREEDLAWWRQVIAKLATDGQTLYAFFNNHYSGHSPSTARRMLELLDE